MNQQELNGGAWELGSTHGRTIDGDAVGADIATSLIEKALATGASDAEKVCYVTGILNESNNSADFFANGPASIHKQLRKLFSGPNPSVDAADQVGQGYYDQKVSWVRKSLEE